MLKETILMVQTCDLKVEINCDGCAKKIKKIMHKIDGVYQTNVNRQQAKVTVTGVLDMDTVFKKLKKAGMSVQLWDANSAAVNKHQKLQLGGNDMGDQIKDASDKGLPQVEASSSGGCVASRGGGTNDATMVLRQLTPTPEQHLANIQQQIEQRLQTLKVKNLPPHLMGMPPTINRGGMLSGKKIGGGTKVLEPGNANNDKTLKGKNLPPHLMGMPPTINRGGMLSGKKIGGGTKVLEPGNANNDKKQDVGTKLYQDAGGSQVKNGGIGLSLHNSALGSRNIHSQAKKDSSVGVGSQMMGGSMAPQKGGVMRPTNNMIGPASFPNMGHKGCMSTGPYSHMGGYNVQPSYGGGAVDGFGMPVNNLPGDGYYRSGLEIMQQVARNPMLQQQNMMVQPQQEHEMMMNAHFPHSQNTNYGPGCNGYQLMGNDNGHRYRYHQYSPLMYNPMPLLPQYENIFSDENPNICSLM